MSQFTGGKIQLFDNDGYPLSGGLVYFYEPGTTTAKDTYSDSDLGTANANPVVLDGAGRASVYLSGDYKVAVKNSAGGLVYTEDNINPGAAEVSDADGTEVPNNSFEENTNGDNKTPDGWTLVEYTGSTVVLDTTDQQHGEQAIKFTSTGSGGGAITQSAFMPVTPLREYLVSWLMKSSDAGVKNIVEATWYTSAQAVISTTTLYSAATGNPTSWTRKQEVATPPSTARYVKLRFVGCDSSDATAGSTWFDDVRMDVINRELSGSVGDIKIGAYTTPEDGWLLADGSAVSRTTYAALFTKISTTWGVGDGSTTFNLPNFKGRTPVGVDSGGTVMAVNTPSLGETFGTETHTLITAEIPAHTHSYNQTTWSSGDGEVDDGSPSEYDLDLSSTASGSAGGGGAHNNTQPSIAVNFFIRYR